MTVELRGSLDRVYGAFERFPITGWSVVTVYNGNGSPSAAADCPLGCAFTDEHRNLINLSLIHI